MKKKMKKFGKSIALLLIVSGISTASIFMNSCVHQPYVLPVNMRTGDASICFERDVLPIFQSNCAKSGCHDAGAHKGGYALDNYADVVKKGIVPGNPAASKIWESVSMKIFGVEFMPVDGPALSAADLNVIRLWIETGAIDSGACNTSPCDTSNYSYSGVIAPMMQTYCTGCHNSSSSVGGNLVDYSSVMTAAVNGRLIGDIAHQAGYNAMPLGGNMLQDCQITQVKKWVAAGAPNN